MRSNEIRSEIPLSRCGGVLSGTWTRVDGGGRSEMLAGEASDELSGANEGSLDAVRAFVPDIAGGRSERLGGTHELPPVARAGNGEGLRERERGRGGGSCETVARGSPETL
jgi:hypothetical protein